MKKVLLVISLISVLLLTGCNSNQNNENVSTNYENLAQEISKKDETIKDLEEQIAIMKNEKETNLNSIGSSDSILTDAEALGLGNMMYKLANDAYNSNSIEIDRNEQPYKVLNIDYYKEIFTENKFKKFAGMEKDNSNHEVGNIVYENGNYYFIDELGRGPEHYLGSKLVIKSKDTDKIEFEVTTFLSEDGRLDEILDEMNENIISDWFAIKGQKEPFVLIKENGEWKVDEFIHTFWERK